MKWFKNWGVVVGLLLIGTIVVAANVPEMRLASGKLFVGDLNGKAQPVTISGDITISNTGVAAMAADAIVSADITDGTITASDLGADSVEAAEIATGAVGTAEIAANVIVSADIDKNVLQVTNCQLTLSQLENLRATPIQCVAAPAAGTAIVVHMIEAVWDVTTTGETITANDDDIAVQYDSGTDIAVIDAVGFIDQNTDQVRIIEPNVQGQVAAAGNTACNTTCLGQGGCFVGWDAGTSAFVACDGATADTCVCKGMMTPVAAERIELFNNGGQEYSGGNAANTLSVRIWWSLASTAAFTSGG